MKLKALTLITVAGLTLTSCSNRDRSKKDVDTEKTEKTEQTEDLQFNDVQPSGADVTAILQKAQNGGIPTEDETDAIIDYVEANADDYFRAVHTLVEGIKSLQYDSSDAAQAKITTYANSFDAQWDNYSQSLGILIDMEDKDMLTAFQQSRLKAFADQYKSGLEDFGFILGLAGMGDSAE